MSKLRQLLERPENRARIVARLAGGAKYFNQLVEEVLDAAGRAPAIAMCEPDSIVRAVARAGSWGVVIGEGCYLIPRKPKASRERPDLDLGPVTLDALLGYKGKIELMIRNGVARSIDALNVYEQEVKRDRFKYEQGTSPSIRHQPIVDPHHRGPLVGAYAVARISWSAPPKIVVLHRSKIDQIRLDYSEQWDAGDLDDLDWYGPKTALHMLERQLPMRAALRELLTDAADEPETVTVPVADPRAVMESAAKPEPEPDPLAVMQDAQVGGVAA